MNYSIEFAKKAMLAYSVICKPICNELQMSQTAFDILMFLANNPNHKTARDIVELRHIKANLVSINVEKLVRDGYIVRNEVAGDRRKTSLSYTKKALPIIERGKQIQNNFFEKLLYNLSEEMRETFFSSMNIIEKNLDTILKEN